MRARRQSQQGVRPDDLGRVTVGAMHLPSRLLFAFGDELGELLVDCGVERGSLVVGEQTPPDAVSALGGVHRSGLGPRLEVAPVADERCVERRLVALDRVRRTEEVPARATSAIASNASVASSTTIGSR